MRNSATGTTSRIIAHGVASVCQRPLPMPTAMGWLSRLGKEHMFVWAWGINGCFSVVGAALVPILATSFGLGPVLIVAGCAYLVALPAFYGVLLPAR